MRKCFAFTGLACVAALSTGAVEWSMLVEADGATNRITSADKRYAIDVSFTEHDGAWCGSIANREKNAIVLGFEVMAEPIEVTPRKSALYLPHVYGRRIRNWPVHGVKQKGVDMWTETAKGVFVPFTSKWDAATGSRAVPLPYPSKLATMQWATLNDGKEGFYLASEDPLAGAKDIQIEYDSNGKKLKMGFFFPMFLPHGESYSIPRVVMEKYVGSWHVAAKRYRTWWDTCRKIMNIPDSVRKNFTGFMMVILKQQNGEVVWPYTDFESLGDAALAHGFRHVEFHGWGVGGHDNFYPEYDPDPAMGGREALVNGIKALQAKGLHVSVYSNGQLQQQGGTKWYEKKGFKCPIVKRDGKSMSEYWVKFKNHPGVTFDVACPSSPEWRAQMLKICRDAKTLGFQGFFYDQIGKQWPSVCFDNRHGHRSGEHVFTHDRETMLLNVINAMHKDDPDFVLWSEAFNDTILDSVALYQGLSYVTDDGYNVANRFEDAASCDMFPEMTFYVFPELILTDRNSTPLCTRKRANGCAVTNLRVDFEVRYRADRAYVERGAEPPEGYYDKIVSKPGEESLMKTQTWRANRDYLKCVSDFRRKHGAILLGGTFKADEGFSVKGGRKIVANRWDGANGETGILVWNADDKPVKVSVDFDGRFILASEPERGEVDADEPMPANTLRLYKYRYVSCATALNTHGGSAVETVPPVSYEEMSPRDCAVPAGEPHEWDCRNGIPSIDRPWTPSGAFLIEAEFTPRSTSMYGTRTVWDNLSRAHTGFRLAFTVNKERWTPRFWAGFSNATECVLGPSVQIDPGKPMKFAMYFGANGRVVWDFAGARRDAAIAVAGPIAPQTHLNPVIGACASAPSNPFDGTIERVSITPCKVDMLNLSLAGRAVFVRGEKDAAVTVRIANMSSSAFVGAHVTMEQFVESGRVRNETSKLCDIARGASADVRFAVETRVRPGWNALRVTVANGTESRTRVFRIGVGPREGDQMKALMWGYGTSESVLADFGFTHGLIYLPPGDLAAGEKYDSAVMAGVRLVHDVKVVYPDGEPNEKYMRKRRDGSFPLRGYAKKEVKAPEVSNPVFMETMKKEIEKDVKLYGEHPGLVGALAISEARDLSSPSFNTEHLRYRQDTGREVPPEVEDSTLDSGAGLAMAKKRFPDGVVPDDDPVLAYYRWFWRGGDGWPGYSGGIAEEYHRQISRKDFFVFWDPAVRCPPGWGSGGGVDMLNQWVYAVPEPMNVAGPAEEILAMVAGRPGQIPAIMTQLICYRSQMAPVDKKVSPEPEWVSLRPDAKFPSIPPDVLQEATWSMLAKPVQAVMYHGWATIDESAMSGHGYACTNPETAVRIRHLMRNVVAPLGPTLKRLGRDAPPVAVLESFTTCVFGGPASWGWKAPSITFMQRARLDPRVVYEDTMLRDGLEGVKVLYAPQCAFLPSSVVAKIKEFQRKGGVLVADRQLMKTLKADVVVPVVSFDRPPASDHAEDVDAMEAAREGDAKTRLATMRAKSRMVAQANDLRKKLSARYVPTADSSSPEIAVYSRRWKNARYVVAVNDRRTFGDYVGPWGLTMEKGLPFSGDVSLADADGAVKVVYELSRGGEARFERRGGRIVVPVEYTTNDGRLFAFLPERIASVKVDAPDDVCVGETVRVTLSVLSAAGRPVNALLPAEIRLFDAAGRELDGAGWVCLQGGVCAMDILTNLDDAAGDYRLVCRDRASGLSAECAIRQKRGSRTERGK